MIGLVVSVAVLMLAALPAMLIVSNLRAYRKPPSANGERPQVSLLIPARDEERSIAVALDSAARQWTQVFVLEFPVQTGDFMAQLLQGKLQAGTPFTETRLWFGEHERNAVQRREVDLACRTVILPVLLLEGRLVAARTGEEVGEVSHAGIMHKYG